MPKYCPLCRRPLRTFYFLMPKESIKQCNFCNLLIRIKGEYLELRVGSWHINSQERLTLKNLSYKSKIRGKERMWIDFGKEIKKKLDRIRDIKLMRA